MPAATYDPTTPAGLVRLLSSDKATDGSAFFADNEITALLGLNTGDVRLAAAQALDAMAASEAYLTKKITELDFAVDGTVVAAQLRLNAAELRRQVISGEADGQGLFDWAEMVVNDFAARERRWGQMERSSG